MGKKRIKDNFRTFMLRVEITPTCWVWHGKKQNNGIYGSVRTHPGEMQAHRWVWLMFNGDIPDDHVVHHVCENKLCVNPAHLELLARGEHTKLHQRKKCPRCGHQW
jgi:hypothetical protein